MKKNLGILVAGLLLAAMAGGGIRGTGRTLGTITAFGSIFVNGVEYELGGAQIRINGEPATEADLKVGQVVDVTGIVNDDGITGTAASVEFASDLRGAVTAVDAAGTEFTLLGQTVRVNSATVFDDSLSPASFAGIAAGAVLEVSGYRDAAGALLATQVESSASVDDRVRGVVSHLDTAIFRFTINGLTIDYSAPQQLEGTLANGALVEVRGPRAIGSVLAADKVEVLPAVIAAAAGDAGSVEGLVTSTLAAGAFSLNGQPFILTASTVFAGGTAADLVAGQKAQAEGRFDAAGRIVAEAVVVIFDDSARVFAPVQSVDAAAGKFTVLGLAVEAPSGTQFEDKSRARQRNFSLASLRAGDLVEVRGVELREPRQLRASRVRREDPDSERWLAGRVSGVNGNRLTLLDTPIVIGTNTELGYENGVALDRAQFLRVVGNENVKAEVRLVNGELVADRAEISL
ncbi:MAG: DUF5666 domain-containing protein [Steroidobacteraceae bacterium]